MTLLFVCAFFVVSALLCWLIWPRKAERKVPGYWREGEDALVLQGFVCRRLVFPEIGKRRIWVRERPRATRTIVLLHGFGHRAGHFASMTKDLLRDDHVILVDRNGISADRPSKIGRLSFRAKCQEVIALLKHLHEEGAIRGDLMVAGHSEGGALLPYIAAALPTLVKDVIPIATVPMQRFAIARNLRYWRYAIGAVPSAIRSLVWGTGMVPPKWTARALFTNGRLSNAAFEAFYAGLCPDSGVAFVELMWFYNGEKAYRDARKQGWQGGIRQIAASHDAIMALPVLRAMTARVGSATLRVIMDEPHCFFAAGSLRERTFEVLRQVFDSA